jgi:hypothetical protein
MKQIAAIAIGAVLLSGCASRPSTEQNSAPIAGSHALDQLLAFENPGLCTLSKEATGFLQAMVVADPTVMVGSDDYLRAGKVDAPPALAGRFGKVAMIRHEGWTAFSVRASGTVMGLPLHTIHQSYPTGGDPGDFTLEFAASADTVFPVLRKMGFPVVIGRDISLGPPDGYELFIGLQNNPDAPDRSLLTCGYR